MKEIEIAEKIWQENELYLRKFCSYKLSSHPDLVDDCLQDVFLALLNRLKDNNEIQYPKAWLTKVASNKIKDIYESEKQKSLKQVPFEEEYIKTSENFDYSLTEGIKEKDIEKHLNDILDSLTDREKFLLEEFYQKGTKQTDIAKELGISEISVRQQIFRLKRKVIAKVRKLSG